MGIQETDRLLPVPEMPYDAKCPKCGAEIVDDLADAWYSSEDIDDMPDLSKLVKCSSCQAELNPMAMSEESCFAMAKWYIWVSDIDPDELWWPGPGYRTHCR